MNLLAKQYLVRFMDTIEATELIGWTRRQLFWLTG